jgi:hypothetical protein
MRSRSADQEWPSHQSTPPRWLHLGIVDGASLVGQYYGGTTGEGYESPLQALVRPVQSVGRPRIPVRANHGQQPGRPFWACTLPVPIYSTGYGLYVFKEAFWPPSPDPNLDPQAPFRDQKRLSAI